jgi:hypothetical protein
VQVQAAVGQSRTFQSQTSKVRNCKGHNSQECNQRTLDF